MAANAVQGVGQATAQAVPIDGLRWSVDLAVLKDADTFQGQDGEPMGYAKLAFFGGLISLAVSREDVTKLKPYVGKRVKLGGLLDYERKSNGTDKCRFRVDHVEDAK